MMTNADFQSELSSGTKKLGVSLTCNFKGY